MPLPQRALGSARRPLAHLLPLSALLLFACSDSKAPASSLGIKTPLSATPSSKLRSEFQEIAKGVHTSMSEFQGGQPLIELREQLAKPNLIPAERTKLERKLARELLKTGELSEAKQVLDQALQRAPRTQIGPLLKQRGIVFLRDAELENCIARHNAACCIFPLEGPAQHEITEPAEEAFKSFLACLNHNPEDYEARWLLNLSALALGKHPAGVPAKYLIEPQALEAEEGIARFTDVSSSCGLDAFNLCGGCIVEDFNGDDLLDVVTSSYDVDEPMTLHQNLGDGRFLDRSLESGLANQYGGLNCIAADYDNDGDQDILVLRGAWLFDQGQIRNSLLRNDGQGNFEDITLAAGLNLPARPTQAAVFADLDNDGDLDLYVANESRAEMEALESGAGDYPSQLFRNNGDGTFTDVAKQAGVENNRYGKGVSAGDYDNDGDVDLYVSNIGLNRLYRNNGDLTFDDVAMELELFAPRRSFATWFFDYNNDGWLDLFVGAYRASIENVALDHLGQPHAAARPRLYRNDGQGGFTEVGIEAGLDHAWLPMGANFGDVDGDGWLDIYLATGDPKFESLMPNVLLRNRGGSRFENVTNSAGLGHLQKGHGVAFADIDNDGDQDLYHQLGGFYPDDKYKNALFVNPGSDQRSLVIKLQGSSSNRAGAGARVSLVLEDGDGTTRELHRAVGSVSSFGGSPSRLELGLGEAVGVRSLEVYWPASQTRQVFVGLPLDHALLIREDYGELSLSRLPEFGLPGSPN